jgi:hypothetical protein
MQAFCLLVVIYGVYKLIKEYESVGDRIKRSDNSYESVKSDDWKRRNGQL